VEPADYFRILRDRWALIVTTVVLALTAAWATTTAVSPIGQPQPPTYRATALLLQTFGSSGPGLGTLAAFTTIEPVALRVAEDIEWEGDPISLAGRVSAVADTEAGILRISVTDPNPRAAERIANGFAGGLINYLRERRTEQSTVQAEALQEELDRLSRQIARLDRRIAALPEGSAQAETLTADRNAAVFSYQTVSQQYQQVLSAPTEAPPLEFLQDASARPIQIDQGFQPPQSRTSRLILGGIVGLLAGAALALVVERMNSRIRTRQSAETHFGLPVLAEIPLVSRREQRTVPILDDPVSPAAEATRLLAAGVEHGPPTAWSEQGNGSKGRRHSLKVLLVTSPAPSEGKTSVVTNLAAAYAETGKRALILSCDLRHRGDQGFFGNTSASGAGMSDALRSGDGQGILSDYVRATGHRNIEIVGAGSPTDRPGELLASANLRRALSEARRRADVVLIDTPPLLTAGDATHLLPHVDAVLLVARAGRTSAKLAERTSEILRRLDVPVVGVALNAVKDAAIARGYYRYTTKPESADESISPPDPWKG
jgi:capsular exopolysaccharide synthesis family protein